MNVLEVTGLNKSYGKKVILKDISLQCKTGEIIGVFGRNGTGKSTLLQVIFGTVKADSVQIKINSEIITPKEIIPSKQIAYLPQDTFLPKEKTVREIIPMFFPNGDDQDKIFYAPKIASLEKIKAGKLSMGQLRYFELLLIGNLNHPFMMLDEPFSMIEPLYKDIIKNLLYELKETKGIVLTDHYYNDVLQVSDRNFVIKDAQKIEVRCKDDLVKYEYLNSK
ncbi:ATP-binding cassette domain-containing protein [Aquimarina spongiae]|uniref:ABC-type lipopolysaccharide export system, ATPase component n=1 Tax=Aquimarina spongiae TaxID=570521 RepID=A0A1M6DVS6_9FLAO|nr:ATP-binding cassette domain-containing protein [Aquimarina spongiae]SHI77312.1 ABC-type lipopolysaccharide export system, ATPase component [Aquimarina spongiae]